jgi:hypothetical protein
MKGQLYTPPTSKQIPVWITKINTCIMQQHHQVQHPLSTSWTPSLVQLLDVEQQQLQQSLPKFLSISW